MGAGGRHAQQGGFCDSGEELRRCSVAEDGQPICQVGNVLETGVRQHLGRNHKDRLHHGRLNGHQQRCYIIQQTAF